MPPNVKSVRVIGCSGGNGGGGGGAGGAGSTFFKGSWWGASFSGGGSQGGDANGIKNSGFLGGEGQAGTIGGSPALRAHDGYAPEQSATIPGKEGLFGTPTVFGEYKFSEASKNVFNYNYVSTIRTLIGLEEVCHGGDGGDGGFGGKGCTSGSSIGANGGNGGKGASGFHGALQEAFIDVQPGQVINYQVGIGGAGGAGSQQNTISKFDHNNALCAAGNGNTGKNGQQGRPGIIIIDWNSY
ncbi:hypothetical protein [Spirobacillus cienkowskii]|uniref:hypothetical protein n=1 Tax=Spirobacillus cienkowskii TaxID=495820 RepID=UPI0030D128FB